MASGILYGICVTAGAVFMYAAYDTLDMDLAWLSLALLAVGLFATTGMRKRG